MQDALHRLELDGIEIAYRTVGDDHAPAVVLLHGWASSQRMWDSAQRHLGDRYRCVALDLPGHGSSGKPGWTWYTIPHFADVVAAFLRAIGLDRPALIGHSMGGTIALELASRPTPDLASLVAVNPVVTGRVYSRSIALRQGWIEPAVRFSRRVWPAASRLLTRPPEAFRRRAADYVLRNSEDFGMTSADSALGSMNAVLTWDLRLRLPLIRTRTLVVVGTSDRIVSPAEGELAAREVPGATLLRMATGHHPNDESPQSFYPEIESFLAGGAAL
jgi:pimeloyl-ACP methyl ester carboxylesterase